MKKLSIPRDVAFLLQRLQEKGFDAYVVGGCVRDACMGRSPHDWDITTNATPQETMEVFQNFHVIPTGIKHGTVAVVVHKEVYEITTYRVDGTYSDGRHPDQVVFVADLKEDLARRDFTINAMAYNPTVGLVDLFEGQKDLEKRQIRCVGKAKERFEEDVLRILRALRFASVFDYEIEEETAKAIHELSQSLPKVSMERITAELRKMIQGKGCLRILLSYEPVLATVIPELDTMVGFEQNNPWHYLDVWNHTLKVFEGVMEGGGDELTLWAALFHDIGKPSSCTVLDGVCHFKKHAPVGAQMSDEILRRLKFDNKSREAIVELVLHHDDLIHASRKLVNHMLSQLGEEQMQRIMILRKADLMAHEPSRAQAMMPRFEEAQRDLAEILASSGQVTLKELALRGADLRALGVPEGKTFGKYLKDLLQLVLDGELPNEKEALTQRVREWMQEKA